jgi:hypothetical protein
MAVEIHVACRRDPSTIAQIVRHCRCARIEVGPARSIRAWSPRAHATLLLRERDVAGVVTLHSSDLGLATEYAELVARALEGVAVIDGEVVELAQHHHALTPADLRSAWSALEGRTDTRTQPAAQARRGRDADNRDYSTH